jgi:hypothetical protein
MKKKLLILFALLILSRVAYTQVTSRYSTLSEARIDRLREKIASELPTLKDDHWSGYYSTGYTALDVAPKAGFVIESTCDLGLLDRNFGSVSKRGTEIHLEFQFKNSEQSHRGFPTTFMPIKWGDRRYLIPSENVVKFCNAVNYGSEPRDYLHGFFLFLPGDHEIKVKGFPDLPEKYRPYLLDQPIEAEIVKVGKSTLLPSRGDWNFRDTVVVLNVGKKHGVLEGMEFHVYQTIPASCFITVGKVAGDSCEAVISQDDEEAPLPAVGWKLSTASKY